MKVRLGSDHVVCGLFSNWSKSLPARISFQIQIEDPKQTSFLHLQIHSLILISTPKFRSLIPIAVAGVMESDISLIEVAGEDDSLLQQIPEDDLLNLERKMEGSTAGNSGFFLCSPLLTDRSNATIAGSSTASAGQFDYIYFLLFRTFALRCCTFIWGLDTVSRRLYLLNLNYA